MHLIDHVSARADNAALMVAPLVAAGMKDRSNKPLELVDAEKERREFVESLRRPFNYEQVRQAVLKAVAG